MAKRRKFTNDFKEDALHLAEKVGVKRAAEELDINQDNIRRWKREKSESANVRSKTSQASQEEELKRLRKENLYLRRINDVLKKSAAIFSSDHIGGMK